VAGGVSAGDAGRLRLAGQRPVAPGVAVGEHGRLARVGERSVADTENVALAARSEPQTAAVVEVASPRTCRTGLQPARDVAAKRGRLRAGVARADDVVRRRLEADESCRRRRRRAGGKYGTGQCDPEQRPVGAPRSLASTPSHARAKTLCEPDRTCKKAPWPVHARRQPYACAAEGRRARAQLPSCIGARGRPAQDQPQGSANVGGSGAASPSHHRRRRTRSRGHTPEFATLKRVPSGEVNAYEKTRICRRNRVYAPHT
jgi:hypothetical protein